MPWTDWSKEPLTKVEQRILRLRSGGATFVEIAETMGCSKSSAHKKFKRAERKIKAQRIFDED